MDNYMISYTKGGKNHSSGFRGKTVESARLTAVIKLMHEDLDAAPLYRMKKTGGITFVGYVGFSGGHGRCVGTAWYTVGNKKESHPL